YYVALAGARDEYSAWLYPCRSRPLLPLRVYPAPKSSARPLAQPLDRPPAPMAIGPSSAAYSTAMSCTAGIASASKFAAASYTHIANNGDISYRHFRYDEGRCQAQSFTFLIVV